MAEAVRGAPTPHAAADGRVPDAAPLPPLLQLPRAITSLVVRRDLTLAAVGPTVVACARLAVAGVHTAPGRRSLRSLLLLGDRVHALARTKGAPGGELLTWTVGEYGPPTRAAALGPARPTCLAHPPAYVDKVVIGFDDGTAQLWNVEAGACLHTYTATVGRGALRCLAASPALDVLAAGTDAGAVILFDAKADEALAVFEDAAGAGASRAGATSSSPGGPVTALAFSTGAGPALLAAGGAAGSVGVWSLSDRALAGALPRAHAAAVAGLHFFAGEPRLQSSGADNAVKQWLLDDGDGGSVLRGAAPGDAARLLRSRAGHGAPPCLVRHYGSDGTRLLTAGRDGALRLWSAVRDAASAELSQGAVASRARKLGVAEADLKLPRVVALDAGTVRREGEGGEGEGEEGWRRAPAARTLSLFPRAALRHAGGAYTGATLISLVPLQRACAGRADGGAPARQKEGEGAAPKPTLPLPPSSRPASATGATS